MISAVTTRVGFVLGVTQRLHCGWPEFLTYSSIVSQNIPKIKSYMPVVIISDCRNDFHNDSTEYLYGASSPEHRVTARVHITRNVMLNVKRQVAFCPLGVVVT